MVKESIGDTVHNVLLRSPVRFLPDAARIMRETVWRSIEVYEGKLDGEVACVWGMIPPTILSERAYMWLLTTDIIAEHKFLFIRYSQRWIEEALKHWPEIEGDVLIDNEPAKKWLKFLGAKFLPPVRNRIPFRILRRANG